ncbi:hypothetical protein D3C77_450450 [compost metagenome]
MGHSAYRFGRANALGNVGIAGGGSGRNRAQGLPHPFLKGGAAQVQRQVQADSWYFDQSHHARYQRFEFGVATQQVGLGEFVLQVLQQCVRVITEQNRADATFTLRHQNCTQRALADGKADRGVGTAIPIRARGHAQTRIAGFVKAAVGIEAGFIQCVGDRAGVL